MSLATRCNACGTVFRVVQDQLRVAEGRVRCGRCDEVFSALDGLFDLDGGAPPDWPPAPPQVATAAAAPVDVESVYAGVPSAHSDASLIDKIDSQLMGSHHSEDGSTPSTRIDERDRLEFPDAQFDSESLKEYAAATDTQAATPAPAEEATPEPLDQALTPQFLQPVQAASRRGGARSRGALVATLVVLLSGLALQGVHHFRDLIAASWPASAAVFADWCGVVSCSLQAPRRIEDLSVESSALTRASIPDAFTLSVALRNRGAVSVAPPAVDLSLTDPTGQLVARRVLTPNDFRFEPAVLQPGAESRLQLTLTAGTARVTGYTIEIFYP